MQAFITAPIGTNTRELEQALQNQGVSVSFASDILPAVHVASSIRNKIEAADFICVVLTRSASSANVLFEAGLAVGLKKPLLIIAEPGSQIPFDLEGVAYLKANADNRQALDFHLNAFMQHGLAERRNEREVQPTLEFPVRNVQSGQGSSAAAATPQAMEQMVHSLLVESGLLVSEFGATDKGVDFAIWVDSLASFLGSPILVQLKMGRLSETRLRQEEKRLHRSLVGTGTRTALLIYNDEQHRHFPMVSSAFRAFPLVIRLSLDNFVSLVRSGELLSALRDARNRAVHTS